MTKVFALTTRGLERISSEEIGRVPGAKVTGIGYRRLTATCEGGAKGLLGLQTVDDVFLDLATWSGISRHRKELDILGQRAAALNLAEAVDVISEVREIPTVPGISTTVSFVGRRNYSSREIREAVAASVRASTGWPLREDDRAADLNLRVFIEHETAYVGLRLAAVPLHRRSYKVAHIPGSLKPPVAAALVRLAGVDEGLAILDPCCGAGTIVIEAVRMGVDAYGGDIDPAAALAARANVAAARVDLCVCEWDARALPLVSEGTKAVVTNLPWGREIEVDTALAGLYRGILREIERTLAKGGRAVVLADTPEHLDAAGLLLEEQFEISLYGRSPTVVILRR